MAGRLPGDPSYDEITRNTVGNHMQEEPLCFIGKWYFSKEEIENHSPSRKDGITLKEESHSRKLYCSYLQELGIELKVPQVTIATAMLFCHRFYMHQSHAKNYWQTIATASMFLASKAEETPRWLSDLVVVAYKLANKWDPLAPQRIRKRDIYDKQKETILLGERLLLGTLAFDLNVEHPYKPLVAAVKKLEISQKELVKVAWNYVNDWLCTTLPLQYKPHYIAAGSLFIAAKLQKVKLPTTKGNVWWMQFDVSPKQLEVIIHHMLGLLGKNQKQILPSAVPVSQMTESKSTSGKAMLSSPESCISNDSIAAQDSKNRSFLDTEGASTNDHSTCSQAQPCSDIRDNVKETEGRQISDSGSANITVEDGGDELKMGQSEQNSGVKSASCEASFNKLDVHRIRERLKMRRLDGKAENKLDIETNVEIDNEAWIQKELESGVEMLFSSPEKRKRC
ncbi:hypothetical protein ACH5RR_027397 [Cinchona calisaya]|uniref:Cyclin-like domain-containing protein n=1 Tax=Cinchona calisaya TaxID=153742 RepID=A0ABD2Z8Q2_9GENT